MKIRNEYAKNMEKILTAFINIIKLHLRTQTIHQGFVTVRKLNTQNILFHTLKLYNKDHIQ